MEDPDDGSEVHQVAVFKQPSVHDKGASVRAGVTRLPKSCRGWWCLKLCLSELQKYLCVLSACNLDCTGAACCRCVTGGTWATGGVRIWSVTAWSCRTRCWEVLWRGICPSAWPSCFHRSLSTHPLQWEAKGSAVVAGTDLLWNFFSGHNKYSSIFNISPQSSKKLLHFKRVRWVQQHLTCCHSIPRCVLSYFIWWGLKEREFVFPELSILAL